MDGGSIPPISTNAVPSSRCRADRTEIATRTPRRRPPGRRRGVRRSPGVPDYCPERARGWSCVDPTGRAARGAGDRDPSPSARAGPSGTGGVRADRGVRRDRRRRRRLAADARVTARRPRSWCRAGAPRDGVVRHRVRDARRARPALGRGRTGSVGGGRAGDVGARRARRGRRRGHRRRVRPPRSVGAAWSLGGGAGAAWVPRGSPGRRARTEDHHAGPCCPGAPAARRGRGGARGGAGRGRPGTRGRGAAGRRALGHRHVRRGRAGRRDRALRCPRLAHGGRRRLPGGTARRAGRGQEDQGQGREAVRQEEEGQEEESPARRRTRRSPTRRSPTRSSRTTR